jgi:hypothetical protein
MRALLACEVLLVAALASGVALAGGSAAPVARKSGTPGARAAAAPPAATPARPGALHSASVSRPAAAAPHPKTAPAALGGAARYDAKKGAMLGGTVMPHKP